MILSSRHLPKFLLPGSIIYIMWAIILFTSCDNLMQEEITVFVDDARYGWYFVFIKNVDGELSSQLLNDVDLSKDNFAVIKLADPAKYKLVIYDKDSNEELSKKMKLIKYSGNYDTFMVCMFYYADATNFVDEIFDADYNDPRAEIKRDIESQGRIILDSIMQQQNLHW